MRHPTACFTRLLRVLRNRGRSREDAEDLIQEALVRLTQYCRAGVVHDEAAFLQRAVINLSIDLHRRECRHAWTETPVEELAETLALLDPGPGPDEVLAAQQRLNEVRRILDAISIRTREIYLAHRAGYSHQELASAFGVSISTVEKAIARAVVALMDIQDPQ
ncbi:MAG: RNA polymerase sigma factor [Candidatus Acidiferrales bacterium]